MFAAYVMLPISRLASGPINPRTVGLRTSLQFTIVDDPAAISDAWSRMVAEGNGTAYQRLDWSTAWIEQVAKQNGTKPVLVVAARDEATQFIWPLGLEMSGGLRIVRWLSGRHSNTNRGIYAADAMAALEPSEVRDIFFDVAARMKIDAFVLENQPVTSCGTANPIVTALFSQPSPSNVHICRVNLSFEDFLATRNGPRKWKKLKKKEKILHTAGDYRIETASTPESIDIVLNAYFAQKAARFASLGIRNSFAEPGVREFYRSLAVDSAGRDDGFHLTALWAGGRVRAVAGWIAHQKRRSLVFLSFAADELLNASPGETLIFRMMEQAFVGGAEIIDFGKGEERYKDRWCDEIEPLMTSTLATTVAGQFYVAAFRIREALKRCVKQTPWLWKAVKHMRRLGGSRLAEMNEH